MRLRHMGRARRMVNERAGRIGVHTVAEGTGDNENLLGAGGMNVQERINGTRRDFKNERLASIGLRPEQTGAEAGMAEFLRRNLMPMSGNDTFEVHVVWGMV